MNGQAAAVLEERTQTLVRKFDEHVQENKDDFSDVFKLIKRVEIAQAKIGVVIAGVVIVFQILVGAWVKGLF